MDRNSHPTHPSHILYILVKTSLSLNQDVQDGKRIFRIAVEVAAPITV
jgi:hypothetical protein